MPIKNKHPTFWDNLTIPRSEKVSQPFRHVENKGYSQSGAGYKKASLKSFYANSGSAHEDIEYNLETLRKRSRELYMSAPLATSAIETSRTKVVGQGLRLKSRVDGDILGWDDEKVVDFQRQVEREFALWADSKECDATGMHDFYDFQQLAIKSWLMSGDCFVLIKSQKPSRFNPYGLSMQLIEADRCRTPFFENGMNGMVTSQKLDNGGFIYDGVETDANGKVVAYHFANKHKGELTPGNVETTFQRVLAAGPRTKLPIVLHIMNAERPDQYRGVPMLAPVLEALLQMRRYTEAECTAAVLQSYLTVFITSQTTSASAGLGLPMSAGQEVPGYEPEREYQMAPGAMIRLQDGENITTVEPTHPSGSFDVFVDAVLKQIGASLEIPAEVLIKAFNSNYSASRAALHEAWETFYMRRNWFVNDFCNPIFKCFMYEAVSKGRIDAPGFFTDPLKQKAYLRCDWIGPTPASLDPLKEVNAELLKVENGLSTHEQAALTLNGSSFDANIARLKVENEQLKEAGKSQRTESESTTQPQEGGEQDEGQEQEQVLDDGSDQQSDLDSRRDRG